MREKFNNLRLKDSALLSQVNKICGQRSKIKEEIKLIEKEIVLDLIKGLHWTLSIDQKLFLTCESKDCTKLYDFLMNETYDCVSFENVSVDDHFGFNSDQVRITGSSNSDLLKFIKEQSLLVKVGESFMIKKSQLECDVKSLNAFLDEIE